MSSNQISIQRICDVSLLRLFVETLCDRDTFSEQAIVRLDIGGTSFQIKNAEGADTDTVCYLKDGEVKHPFLKTLYEDSSSNNKISRISLSDRALHTNFSIVYERSSQSFIDKLTLPSQPTNSASLEVVSRICGQLSSMSIQDNSHDASFEIASVHNDVLTRLEGLSINLIREQSETAKEFEVEKKKFIDGQLEDFKSRATDLENEYKEKLNALEEDYQERNKQLDVRQKEIEDADNTTARRKTTTNMLGSVEAKAKKFDFSKTVTSRSVLACFFAVFLAALGIWNTFDATAELKDQIDVIEKSTFPVLDSDIYGNENVSDKISSAVDPKVFELGSSSRISYLNFLYIKIFLSSALLISSLVYLVRWFNSWADRLAQQELDNQMFVRDLNRAHLAVEMSLEWNDKKDGPVPDKLLDAMTNNLFNSSDTKPQELLHPAEQLATALLKSADRINLPFGSGDLSLTGKKIRKARVNSVT